MYTLRAILLSKQSIRDNQIRVILFTEEFGKITGWSKKSNEPTDIGSVVEILIERKKQENIIHKITPLHIPKNDGWNYNATIEYLVFFQVMKECLPEGMEQRGIFDDTKEVMEYLSKNDFSNLLDNTRLVQLFILMKARLMKKQGYLREELFVTKNILPIIYTRLDTASMKSMISSKNIHEDDLKEIQYAIHEGIYTLKNRI